jgi:hypothetical protein
MWNLAKIGAVIAICLSVAGSGWAHGGPKQNLPRAGQIKPSVLLSVPKTPLQFGRVYGVGPTQLRAEVTARVLANCPFRLAASFQGLTETGGKQVAIPATQIAVRINGKEVPVGTELVEIATGMPTPPSGVNVPVVIEMELKQGAASCPAGQYGGNLALKVTVGS